MRVLVVYESMFGNTHVVADHIGDGLRADHEVVTMSVGDAFDSMLDDFDLLVLGGPTHAHGVSTAASRKSARESADKDDELDFEPEVDGPGLREWIKGIAGHRHLSACFDTRIDGPAALTGRASKGIDRRLRRYGFRQLVEPESFLVDKHSHLLPGEADRATEWGEVVAARLSVAVSTS